MAPAGKKLRIGVLGCGAIGSRIAKSVTQELKDYCQLTGFYDCDPAKMTALAKVLKKPDLKKRSLKELIQNCDLMVEAVNSPLTDQFVYQALNSGRHVLAMSVGRLVVSQDKIFKAASRHGSHLLVPSGAIAGIDALKAASLVAIKKIILTTRKPVNGFTQSEYLERRKIYLATLTGETVLFDGPVKEAVKYFPQNINVAATLAFASGMMNKIRVRILTSPEYKINSHEIEINGDCGRITTRTENVTCPDNPKTSWLAVLSAIKTLKDFCTGYRIGT
jgi:aspartate dehydrogenase